MFTKRKDGGGLKAAMAAAEDGKVRATARDEMRASDRAQDRMWLALAEAGHGVGRLRAAGCLEGLALKLVTGEVRT